MKKYFAITVASFVVGITANAQTNYGSSTINQTSGSTPTIFKNNGTELMRIQPSGNVGVGTNSPAEKLHINGNLKVDGNIISNGTSSFSNSTFTGTTTMDKLKINRIAPLVGDSIINLGDSTIKINSFANNITFTPTSVGGMPVGGLAIGNGVSFSVPVIGTIYVPNYAFGTNSLALGYKTGTGSSAANAIIIGAGSSTSKLINPNVNSLWVGFNSNIPTFVVGASNGDGTSGNVGIGTSSPTLPLQVSVPSTQTPLNVFGIYNGSTNNFLVKSNGFVYAREINVLPNNLTFPDYVFDKKYKLMPLSDVEKYIQSNKHLPKIPDAATVQKNGINIAELQVLQMEKIEELYLYIIQLKKENEKLNSKMAELDSKMKVNNK